MDWSAFFADILTKQVLKTPETVELLVREANEEYKKSRPDYKSAINSARENLRSLDAKLDKITDQILISTDKTEKSVWTDKLKRTQEERQSVSDQIKSFESKAPDSVDLELNADRINHALNDLFQNFQALDGETKNALLSNLVDQVQVRKNEIEISIINPGIFLDQSNPISDAVNQGVPVLDLGSKWLPRNPMSLKIFRFQK